MRNQFYLEELEKLAEHNEELEYIAFRLREALEGYEKDLQIERNKQCLHSK